MQESIFRKAGVRGVRAQVGGGYKISAPDFIESAEERLWIKPFLEAYSGQNFFEKLRLPGFFAGEHSSPAKNSKLKYPTVPWEKSALRIQTHIPKRQDLFAGVRPSCLC